MEDEREKNEMKAFVEKQAKAFSLGPSDISMAQDFANMPSRHQLITLFIASLAMQKGQSVLAEDITEKWDPPGTFKTNVHKECDKILLNPAATGYSTNIDTE